jgi:DNA-binding GntR family transcriptional regulator
VIPKARDVAGADRAYQRLRNEIVSGQLQPNQRLIEADVSARLGVSRATVRALLSHLSHDGLVVREANRGAHVRFISIEEAIEITQARAALEALAAQQAADRATATPTAIGGYTRAFSRSRNTVPYNGWSGT